MAPNLTPKAATAYQLPASVAIVSSANTFTAEQTVPDLVATGLTGATAASRYVGATTSGAPVSGTFVIGDFVIDRTGIIWVCTTAGSPGTWTPIQPNVELGYAEITSSAPASPFVNNTSTPVAITGLSVTVTTGARPVDVIANLSMQALTTNITDASVLIFEDGVQVQRADGTIPPSAQLYAQNVTVRARRNPAAGSHTYDVRGLTEVASHTWWALATASPRQTASIQVLQV